MPENTVQMPGLAMADHLLDMAHAIETFGLWTDGPNFVDPARERLDVPAAAVWATTGSLPFLFALPTRDAADVARTYIEAVPAAMTVLLAIAAHMATVLPDADWTDDPIERLAAWPNLLGVTPDQIPQTLRDLAHTLTLAATAPMAA